MSLWVALTWSQLVSKVQHVSISTFRSTLWSSIVSTYLKARSSHLTPPHYFLCSLPVCQHVCVCWWTTPLVILSPIVAHFLWTCWGMWGWPFDNYGRFQKVITGDEHLKWPATKIPQCLSACRRWNPEPDETYISWVIPCLWKEEWHWRLSENTQ